MNHIYKSLKQFYKRSKEEEMFSQKKIQQFTLQNYHWLIAIFLYQLIIYATTMSFSEITGANAIYIKIGLVILYTFIAGAYLILVYFMFYASINNIEKVTPIINTTSVSQNEFNFDDIK